MLLDNIALFLLIVEKGSLAAAGREKGLSPTTVSERLAALEAHYGVGLLNRTTRSISLTEEGRVLFDGAKTVLAEVEDLDTRIRHGAETLSGPIRISAPLDTGRVVISDVIAEFLARHPAITIDLSLSDGYVDIVGRGFDIAVRYGTITDSTLRIRPLGPVRRIVCASSAYLERNGVPAEPEDLLDHNCVLMRFGSGVDNIWHLGSGTNEHVITVRGDRVSDDGGLVRQWALSGYGIAMKSEIDVGPDIKSGKLVEILEAYRPPPAPLQIMYPPGRAQPRRVRALAREIQRAVTSRLSG
ncbi:LysR family transcriptional regulator [Roseibium sp.]|uniref:LysR family transcriptional regulator n=1 Tax=Roseibium sp. TaxID=1936156 RepID=UPI003B517AD8